MPLHITINGNPVTFSETYPEHQKGVQLYGSSCFYAAASWGTLLIEYLENYGFGFFCIRATVEEPLRINIRLPRLFFICHINLLQPFGLQSSSGTEAVRCKRNSASLAFTSLSGYTVHLEKGGYNSVTVVYPVSDVKKILLQFPRLEGFREKLKREEEIIMPDVVAPIFAAISHCVHEILHVPRMFFTEHHHQANMTRLLKEVFRYMSENAAPQPLVSLSDLDSVKNAKEWLDMNLDKHITIAELARKVGTNEFKLKKSFKELFNIGVYGYLLQQRLLIAKKQLEETNLPIREIARRANYRKAKNFSFAFKRAYGITPTQLRQQSRQ